MRGRVDSFREHWIGHAVSTPAGEVTYTVFPGAGTPFVGCTRLDGVPIAPADAHRHLEGVGHEHAAMTFLGEGPPRLSPFTTAPEAAH